MINPWTHSLPCKWETLDVHDAWRTRKPHCSHFQLFKEENLVLNHCHGPDLKSRDAFVPPKPKEFDRAALTGISFERVKGMKVLLNMGSGSAILSDKGATPCNKTPQNMNLYFFWLRMKTTLCKVWIRTSYKSVQKHEHYATMPGSETWASAYICLWMKGNPDMSSS